MLLSDAERTRVTSAIKNLEAEVKALEVKLTELQHFHSSAWEAYGSELCAGAMCCEELNCVRKYGKRQRSLRWKKYLSGIQCLSRAEQLLRKELQQLERRAGNLIRAGKTSLKLCDNGRNQKVCIRLLRTPRFRSSGKDGLFYFVERGANEKQPPQRAGCFLLSMLPVSPPDTAASPSHRTMCRSFFSTRHLPPLFLSGDIDFLPLMTPFAMRRLCIVSVSCAPLRSSAKFALSEKRFIALLRVVGT